MANMPKLATIKLYIQYCLTAWDNTKEVLFKMRKMNKKGQAMGVGAVIALIVGAGVSSLVLIIVSVLAGQTFQIAEPQIVAITNSTIEGKVRQSATAGFDALVTTGNYMPLIILAFVAFMVLGLVLSYQVFSGGRAGGSVL